MLFEIERQKLIAHFILELNICFYKNLHFFAKN